MEWIAAEARKGANPRTYVLVGVLALALVWAVVENTAPKRRAAGTPAAAVSSAGAPASFAEPTPAGWGRDPFDPRAVSADVNAKGR